MRMTVNFSNFVEAFRKAGREDQFSYDGLRVLFDHLEEMDENYELDVIELCCDYQEFDSFEEVREQYSDCKEMDDEATLDWLHDNTLVVSEEPILIQQF